MKPLQVLVLAAGQGSRMKSALPKVLHPMGGRPLLEHVLETVKGLRPKEIGVVLGVGREQVRDSLAKRGWNDLAFAVQREPKGSGHAVFSARPWLRLKKGTLLIVYGDTPLLKTETLRQLVRAHAASGRAATFLAMDLPDPAGYGRMMQDAGGLLERIVEDKDANADEKKVSIVNSGVACWEIEPLLKALPKIRPTNAKREYYLTDAAAILRAMGHGVGIVIAGDAMEMKGVNTRADLAECEAASRRRILRKWMLEGVTIVDPETTYIDAEARLAPDCRIWPGSMIYGASRIASHCEVGPYTIIEDAVLREGARVGPFARIRPGSIIGEKARVGNFVETKNVTLGEGAKANHLTYLGDAAIGAHVNIGAGTITCNYDGFAKHRTVIGANVFVGSNTNLVAPVRIGRDAMIAAGSTVTQDVPAKALAVARARQETKPGWSEKFRNRRMKGSHA